MTYPFPNFNGATVEVWKWIRLNPTSHFIPHFTRRVIAYPCSGMLGSKLIHVSERAPGKWPQYNITKAQSLYIILGIICFRCNQHRTNLQTLCNINSLRPSDAYMRLQNIPTLLQIMVCRLFGTKPLSEPMLPNCQLDPWEQISVKIWVGFLYVSVKKNSFENVVWENGGHFVQEEMS